MSAPAFVQPAAALKAAMLSISGLRLMLPQNEISALDGVAAIDVRDAAPFSVGWFQHSQQRWPVYCLSDDLSLLVAIPSERRTCALLTAGAGCVGILCDDVSVEVPVGERHDLPPAMRLSHTPVLGLVLLDEDKVGCITSAECLAVHAALLAGA